MYHPLSIWEPEKNEVKADDSGFTGSAESQQVLELGPSLWGISLVLGALQQSAPMALLVSGILSYEQ